MYHIHTHTYIYFYTYDIGFVFGYRKTNKQEKDRNPREKWAEDLHMQYIRVYQTDNKSYMQFNFISIKGNAN